MTFSSKTKKTEPRIRFKKIVVMKKTSLIFTISLILWSASPLFAQVILPTFISDNMVLQQQTDAPL
jgi:hypothetical protein